MTSCMGAGTDSSPCQRLPTTCSACHSSRMAAPSDSPHRHPTALSDPDAARLIQAAKWEHRQTTVAARRCLQASSPAGATAAACACAEAGSSKPGPQPPGSGTRWLACLELRLDCGRRSCWLPPWFGCRRPVPDARVRCPPGAPACIASHRPIVLTCCRWPTRRGRLQPPHWPPWTARGSSWSARRTAWSRHALAASPAQLSTAGMGAARAAGEWPLLPPLHAAPPLPLQPRRTPPPRSPTVPHRRSTRTCSTRGASSLSCPASAASATPGTTQTWSGRRGTARR